ncbi:hypothetical protein F8S13_03985 [Chloroflexia bacterium SDU3-3]|nr:hypothetical protein F8S13_03985 [Chloroflexia bacterium SDU3-3]
MPHLRPARVALIALALLAALLPQRSPARSQDVFHLLKDMTPGTSYRESRPQDTVVLGDFIYFITDDYTYSENAQLWRTDGTDAGTTMIMDFPIDAFYEVYQLQVAGDRLFFLANSIVYGVELWTSDGTAAGTHMVADIAPGHQSSFTDHGPDLNQSFRFPLAALDGVVYFSPDDQTLWRTDGTESNTKQVLSLKNNFIDLRVFDGKLYITDTLYHLWVTDATEQGTQKLIDFTSDFTPAFLANNSYLVPFNNKRYLLDVGQSNTISNLWATDGTPTGTSIAASIPRRNSNSTSIPIVVNSKLAFLIEGDSNIELWASDGTEAGTAVTSSLPYGYFSAPLLINGHMLFTITPYYGAKQAQLWSSDGTEAGTKLVTTLDTSDKKFTMRSVGGYAVFCDTTCWSSDGTAAGTTQITDSTVLWLYTASELDGALIAPIKSGSATSLMARTDGTKAGTSQFFSKNMPASSITIRTAVLGNTRFIATTTGLWETDGTPAGTEERTGITSKFPTGAALEAMVPFSGTLVLQENHRDASYNNFSGLWRSDGTPAGTSLIKNFDRPIGSMLVLQHTLYLLDYDGTLWASDGTEAGTKTIATGLSAPHLLSVGSDLLVETLTFGSGTGNKTARVLKLNTASSSLVEISPTSDAAWFYGDRIGKSAYWTISSGSQVGWWRYDEGASAPALIATIQTDLPTARGGSTFLWNNKPTFMCYGDTAAELWQGDGTAEGATRLQTIPADIQNLATAGPYIYFVQENSALQHQLWRTDGTAEGTILLKDADPRMAQGYIEFQEAIGGKIYFTTSTPDTGMELWSSDGTPEGTKLYADINPGPAGSTPRIMLNLGSALLVQATTASYGRELYLVDIPVGSERLYLPLAQQ